MIEINDNEYKLLKDYLLQISGIDITSEKRYLFKVRLGKILNSSKYNSFAEFYTQLIEDEKIKKLLIESMTNNETSFFRDGYPFKTLILKIMPEMISTKLSNVSFLEPQIKILSAGCSTGQEPYSIAMTVNELLNNNNNKIKVQIVAVDVSGKALDYAKRGTYTEKEIKAGLPQVYQEKYFSKTGKNWIINSHIKKMIHFAELNLAEPIDKIGFFDIVFCRNVIIYFNMDLKYKILKQFYNMLNPNGTLILGASETTYKISDKFISVCFGDALYYTPNLVVNEAKN